MSKLDFDGAAHLLALVDKNGKVAGTWPAYNNVDSHATLRHLPNGAFHVQDRIAPHFHIPDANGPYGLYGIIRFNVPGHSGIGVHSGRAHARHLPGPEHPTMGCIRTTDAAMLAISKLIKTDSLTMIEVKRNNATSAQAASQRNRNRISLQGLQHG